MELVRSSISIVSGLPRETVGSAPAIIFSGPAQRSLTLRPARSRSRLATLYTESSDSFVASAAASIATGWSEPVPGVGIEPRRAHWVMKRPSHVSSGPPAIPEGRISRFRFWPWLFPRGLSKIGEAQALARIHPTYVGLPLDSSFQSWLLRLTPLAIRGPPSAQSSFACHKCDSWQSGVQRHLEERYPFFIAPTSSCAKPASSSGLRVSTLISRGPGRLLRAPAGNWFFRVEETR
jgi:hypothetical protein